ncbi:restriction endonuclease subunit S [Burkholderia multivorans]|uniref:restriction endonuclease subunit S n=1 Tax=Burkholderia multivorans TaxID=87883 RepID=UPI0020B40031|nr:restriction endonuclease subunit S [Burkholderia multivorans]
MQSEVRPLRDLCSLIADCPHSTPVWTDSGYLVIRNQNIKGGRLDLSSPSFTDAEHFAHRIRRAKPREGDIVFTREAPMGEVCMIPKGLECCVGQRQVLLRPDPDVVDGRYLLYALQSPQVQHEIGWNEGTGSTVSNVRIPVLESLKIPTPSIAVQRDIGSVLSALDDRIDLLRQTNATLESIAQTLFKSWFIHFDPVRAKAEGREPEGMDADTAALFPDSFEDSALGEIPTGWRVGTLGEIASNPRSQAKPGQMASSTPYIGLEHMPRKSISLDRLGTAEGLESGKFWFEQYDVLFGKLRPYFHKVGLAPCRGVCSTDILVIRPKKPHWLGYVLMHASSDELIAHTTLLSNGARMPRTSWNDIDAYKVVLPDERSATAFNEVAHRFFERIFSNMAEMTTLSKLRDTLLPRLISGKLRLPEAEAQLNEAPA